jgi:hypothetical protein
MALQIRRGVDGSGTGGRLTITPAVGELLYTTDTKHLYIGDGSTVGGNIVSGGGGGGLNSIVEDTSPQLGGNLDTNGHTITSSSNGNITISPNGSGKIILDKVISADSIVTIAPTTTDNVLLPAITQFGTPTYDGNITITRNNFSIETGAGLIFQQFHTNSNATPMVFYRARGQLGTEQPVQTLDRLGTIAFAGWDGTAPTIAAGITVATGATPTTGHVPGKFVISTDNGTAFAPRLIISNLGVIQFNSLAALSGPTITVANNLQLNAQSSLRFADSDSSNYVGFKSPATVSANVTWTLPSVDGTNGQVLTTNGGGTLSWGTVSAGGLSSRSTVVANTGSVGDGTVTNVDVAGFKSYVLLKLVTSHACRVRIYTTSAARTADASRSEGVTPSQGAGVVADIVATGAQTIILAPGIFGHNEESSPSPTTNIPFAITNKSGGTATVIATLSVLQLEA